MKAIGRTHTGMVRKNNQDSFLTDMYETYCVLAVADGLGGHKGGEVASRLAVDTIHEGGVCEGEEPFETVRSCMNGVIDLANERILRASLKDESLSNMGTTLCMAIAKQGDVSIFNVGDSRAYLIQQKAISQITRDHSLVQQLVDNRQITPEEAVNHPQKNVILRALGIESKTFSDRTDISMKPGERLLLCSDGLTNNCTEGEIQKIASSDELLSAAEQLILRANQNGGTDNITVVLYDPFTEI